MLVAKDLISRKCQQLPSDEGQRAVLERAINEPVEHHDGLNAIQAKSRAEHYAFEVVSQA
jgi:hypothetical protein